MNELKIPAFSTKCKIFKYLTVSFEGELNRFPDKSFNCRINATPSSSGLSYSRPLAPNSPRVTRLATNR